MYLVYNVSNQDSATSPVVSPYEGLGLTQNHAAESHLSVSYTRLFGSRIVNEARGGFNIQNSFRRSNQTLRQFLRASGLTTRTSRPMEPWWDAGARYLWPSRHQLRDRFRQFHQRRTQHLPAARPEPCHFRRHSELDQRKAHAEVRRRPVRNAATDGFANNRGNPRGLIRYGGTGPDAFARFVMGLPADSAQFVTGLRPPMQVYNWEHGYFVQDDFKVSSAADVESRTALRDHLAVHRSQRHPGELRSDLCFAERHQGSVRDSFENDAGLARPAHPVLWLRSRE